MNINFSFPYVEQCLGNWITLTSASCKAGVTLAGNESRCTVPKFCNTDVIKDLEVIGDMKHTDE